ncbi:Mth938-like domain-containing protein [Aestuariibius sp. HNIBRBA575]|uniref:Mth938-like domain-containing protein n=1 Tax=Aestuariibius sp. HNIBRBA575 TaxID=3233343 RepID=UPI0034A0D8F0
MRLNEISYNGNLPIDGYGPGFFRVGGDVFNGPHAVLPSGVVAWGGYDDTATLIAALDDLDVLFIGMGAEMAHLPNGFKTTLEEAGLNVEGMASPTAARTYNVLLSEGRRVGVALLPL